MEVIGDLYIVRVLFGSLGLVHGENDMETVSLFGLKFPYVAFSRI